MTNYVYVKLDNMGNVVATQMLPQPAEMGAEWQLVDKPVEVNRHAIFDGVVVDKGAPPSEDHDWNANNRTWELNVDKRVLRQSNLITAIRNKLRDMPITLDNGWRMDADRDSVDMMVERIDQWGNGTYTQDEQGRQMWKDADNEHRHFTYDEFVDMVAEVRRKRAIRHDINFAYGEQMRAQLPLPLDHSVFSMETWPG